MRCSAGDVDAAREPHRLIAATVGVAIPRDNKLYGYLSEHHSFGENEDTAGDYAEELAAEMLATTLGLEFDPDKSWDENKEVYRLSNQIVRTQNVTQTAIGDKKGLWSTVVAAAVLVSAIPPLMLRPPAPKRTSGPYSEVSYSE